MISGGVGRAVARPAAALLDLLDPPPGAALTRPGIATPLGRGTQGRDLGGPDDGGRTGVGVHGPSGTRPGDECEITLLMIVHLLQGGMLRRAGERFQTPASPARRVKSLLRRFLLGLGLPLRRPILAHPLGDGPALLLAHRALAPADRLGRLLPAAPGGRRHVALYRALYGNKLALERALLVAQHVQDSTLRLVHFSSRRSARIILRWLPARNNMQGNAAGRRADGTLPSDTPTGARAAIRQRRKITTRFPGPRTSASA